MNKLTILLISLLPLSLIAQNYAGDDETICQGSGIQIGNPTPDPDLCYTWDMAEGLDPGDIHNPNPTVYPQTETTYTVHVTGDGFGFSASDQVTIDVDFGGLTVTPSYIDLSGPLTDQAQAELNINMFQGNANDIIWSLENVGSSGCSITQEGAISNCSESTTLTVKATNAEFPACTATKTLEVNGGIRDVTAEDNSNAGRIARAGQKLYTVGTGQARIRALPNENSQIPAGQPMWTGSHTPPPGNEFDWLTPFLDPGVYNYEAGEIDPKSVQVENISIDKETFEYNLPLEFIGLIVNGVKGDRETSNYFFCLPFNVDLAQFDQFKIQYSQERAPKYQDPDWDYKYSASLSMPVSSISGCVFFPCCSAGGRIGPVSVFMFSYMKASLGLGVSFNCEKDPNTPNPEWVASNIAVSLVGQLEAGLRLEANAPAGYGAVATALLTSGASGFGRTDGEKLEWKADWGGLNGVLSASIFYGSPDHVLGVSETWNLLNGGTTDWQLLYEFPEE